ncbi:MAG: GntR family transcriptional regulator [Oscillospiraceae bacterium]|nr:GntR family transcriptional regulator [Oscillospiraceae bacterium]
MIDFNDFTPTDGIPIYQQIVNCIKHGVVAGTIVDGDELPSRRVVSALLGINPNTVQKAFRILEEEGYVESRTGAKSVMTVTAEQRRVIEAEQLEEYVRSMAHRLKEMAVSRDDAVRLIEKFWDED